VDVEHQPTDLAVGGSNPSRRATKPAGQWPYGGVAYCSGTAGLRPNCDHVGGHSLSDCDHLRPPWLMPAPLLLVSAVVEAPARDRLWVLRAFDIDDGKDGAAGSIPAGAPPARETAASAGWGRQLVIEASFEVTSAGVLGDARSPAGPASDP
jgi:hypothetical protein